MNINELIADCKAKGEELAGLKEEEGKLREEVGQKIKANYQIFKEYYENTFLSVYNMLSNTTGKSVSACKVEVYRFDINESRRLVIKAKDYAWRPCLMLERSKSTVEGDLVDSILVDMGNFGSAYYEEWSLLFGSEDKVNKLIEYINKYFEGILEIYLNDIIPTEMTDFKGRVEALKEALSDSHTVEEKEDGTVEIRLGGKTYIGTLKEE